MLNVIMNYLRQMPHDEICFDFAYLFETETVTYRDEILSYGGRIFSPGTPKHPCSCRRRLRECLLSSERHYTAIHFHPIYASVLFFGIAEEVGIRYTIQHSHSTKYSDSRVASVRNRILSHLIPRCSTHLAACSERAAKLLRANGRPVFMLPNAVDVGRFGFDDEARREIRRELSLGDCPTVLHVGRFSPEKNHVFLIEVIAAALKIEPSLKFILAGDGELRGKIERLCAERNIGDAVIFTGVRQDIPKLISAADVFVFPSVFEGVPVAAVEAQISGLPCILSDTLTDEIDLGRAVRLPTDDSEAWGRAVCDALADGRCEAVEKTRTAGFDISANAEKLKAFYESLDGNGEDERDVCS